MKLTDIEKWVIGGLVTVLLAFGGVSLALAQTDTTGSSTDQLYPSVDNSVTGSSSVDSGGLNSTDTSSGSQTTTGSTGTAGTATTSSSGSATPGIPNTGDGGNAANNLLVLVASGVVALGGGLLLARTRNKITPWA